MRVQTQQTLRRSSEWVDGRQLDRDGAARARFHPASAGTGIAFVRSDLPGEPRVRCEPGALRDMPRWTSIERDGLFVHHTEHVLAALAGAGVDNVEVELVSDRLPVPQGGSCAAFSRALSAAGLRDQVEPRLVWAVRRPLMVERRLTALDGRGGELAAGSTGYVVAVPGDHFQVCCMVAYRTNDATLVGLADFDDQAHRFADSLADARTYYLRAEEQGLRETLGEVRSDFMCLDEHSPQPLLSEAASHKIADLIGDLATLGHRVTGRFLMSRSGHQLHRDLVRQLAGGAAVLVHEAATDGR